MKPKPLVSLNNYTVPLAIVKTPVFIAAREIAAARLGQLGIECCGPMTVTGIERSNVATPDMPPNQPKIKMYHLLRQFPADLLAFGPPD